MNRTPRPTLTVRIHLLLLFVAVVASGSPVGSGQGDPAGSPPSPSRYVGLPEEELFQPLLGDPKEPRTFATVLHVHAGDKSTTVGAVGFGERLGIIERRGLTPTAGWQFGLAGGVFAQFDLETDSSDLINADYVIGLPFTWRRGTWSGRVSLYHQSSHLGDEFLLHQKPERINLSFEAIEVLVARDLGPWRFFGGGEYLIDPEPATLASGVLHAGVEYRHPRRSIGIGRLGGGRWVGAIDMKALEEHAWKVAWSLRAGLELSPVDTRPGTRRRWSLMLEIYEGPSPWGQFYETDASYVGLGIHYSL